VNVSDVCIKTIQSGTKLSEKGKSIPVRGRGGPYDCETSRLPHFLDNRLTVGGEVVSLTRWLAAFYSSGRLIIRG
jgi:hypothetical protein